MHENDANVIGAPDTPTMCSISVHYNIAYFVKDHDIFETEHD